MVAATPGCYPPGTPPTHSVFDGVIVDVNNLWMGDGWVGGCLSGWVTKLADRPAGEVVDAWLVKL